MIIDGHLHLDREKYPLLKEACANLLKDMDDSGIDLAWLINNPLSKESIEDIASLTSENKDRFKLFRALDHFDLESLSDYLDQTLVLGVSGLKFHPRLQNMALDDPQILKVLSQIEDAKLSIIIDCFPSGKGLVDNSFGAKLLGSMVNKFPKIKFIAAHAGGHHILDFMLLAKEYSNLYLDISYSLLAYQGSRVVEDFAYVINKLQGRKIIYGSDYPSLALGKSLEGSRQLLNELGVKESYLKLIFGQNASEVLGV